MIRLQPNTPAQTFYASPFGARKFLAVFTNYLIEFKSQATSKTFRVVGDATSDNERYSIFAIDTSVDAPTSGDIVLDESGLYTFTIWGQNSTTNLDPTDAVVVGECEKGVMQIIGEDAWTIPTINIPNNVVYYE